MTTLDRFGKRIPRRDTRRPISKLAELIVDGGNSPAIKCHVVEISDNGARVVTHLTVRIPEFLVLRFSDCPEHRVRRCWTKGKVFGFEFVRDGTERRPK